MASNELPGPIDKVFTLADDMADGLENDSNQAEPIDIKQNTAPVIRAALLAATQAQEAYNTVRGQRGTIASAVAVADSNGKAFTGLARNVLKPFLGNDWSETWLSTGFPNQSLAIPETIQERQALLQSLKAYFASHTAQENAPLNVTAARAEILFKALSDARSALNTHLTLSGQKQATRDAAVKALRKRMSGLVAELGQLIADDDPRWLGFGLNMPASPDTPDIPDAPILTAIDADSLLAVWPDEPRATRYRVWRQIVGADVNFVAVATVNDHDANLDNLPSGVTIRIRISAANDTGESQPGPASEIVL